MKPDKVERLLKKYQAGDISLAEERYLKKYFSENEVPAHLEHYKEQILKQGKSQNFIEPKGSGKKFYVWSGVVVLVFLVIGLIFFLKLQSPTSKNSELGSIQDEEVALEKTQETLKMVSEILNKRKKDLGYLKEFNKTREKIIKHE